MIPKTCETCELHSCYQRHANKPCQDWSPDLVHWDAKIAALNEDIELFRNQNAHYRERVQDSLDKVNATQAERDPLQGAPPMIERKCETCELHKFHCYLTDCREPERGHWIPSRAALEARIEALEDVARKLAAEATRVINDVIAKGVEARTERAGLAAQLAEAERRSDELRARIEDWAAQYRALRASVESELGGLRHSLAEVEDERDEAVSAMAEWRARAEVAEPERDRERARAEAYRAALLEANRRRKLAIARSAEVFRMLIFRAEAAEARERKLNALGLRPMPETGEEP